MPPFAPTTRLRLLLGGLVLLAHAVCHAAEAELPAGLRAGPAVGGVQEYRLDNGLQLLLMPLADHPVTRVTMTYRVGSRHEGQGEAGMAHLLEHVTFRGTRSLPELAGELNRLAVTFNGTTTTERTNYLDIFKPDAAVLRQVLQIEASRMNECRLDAADFEKEKPIVLDEMGLRSGSTDRQLMAAVQAASFRVHPYGRPVIGYTADIEQLSLPTLRRFYEQHYRPDNAVLMIAGAFERVQALAAVAEIFGPLRPAQAPPALLAPLEAEQKGVRSLSLRTPQTGIGVAFRVPGMAHDDAPPLAVLAGFLSATSRNWLAEVDRRGQMTVVNPRMHTREPFLFGMVMTLPGIDSRDAAAREKLQGLQERWLDRLDRSMARSPIFEYAVQTLARTLAGTMEQRLRNPETASADISDAIGAGDWRLAFKFVSALQKVSIDDVLRVEGRYLRKLNRAVVLGVTDPVQREPEFAEAEPGLMDRLFARKADVPIVADPSGNLDAVKASASREVESFDTDPAAIEKRVKRYRLPSGVMLAVLPKANADDKVVAELQLRWGSTREMALQQAWRGLYSVAERGGTQRTALEAMTILRALQAEIKVSSGPQSVRVEITTREKLLAPALAYVKEFLSQPALRTADFAEDRLSAVKALAATAASTGVSAAQRRHINQQRGDTMNDPGYLPSAGDIAVGWAALDVEQVRRFHRAYWSANDARIAIVGRVPEKIIGTVESLFGDWKKPEAPAFKAEPDRHLTVGGARFVTPRADSTSATVSLLQEIPLGRDAVAYPPALVGVQLLAAQGVMGGRLAERLRQQDAISYAVQAQLVTPERGDRSLVHIIASGSPQAALRVEDAIREELTRLLRDGVSAQEVDVAQRQLLEQRRRLRNDDRALALALLSHFDQSGGFVSNEGELDTALQAVTPGQVQAALRLLLHPDRWIVAVDGITDPR